MIQFHKRFFLHNGEHRLHTLRSKKPVWRATILLALAALLLAGCAGVGLNNWPGLTVADGAVYYSQLQLAKIDAATGAQIWRYPDKVDPKNTFFAAPAVVNDRVIAGNFNNQVVALDTQSRNVIWTFKDYEGKGRFVAGPVLAGDLVLIPSTDRYLYGLDVNSGIMRWRFKARDALWGAVATDGTLAYLPGMDHYLYAVDISSGQLAWEIDLGGAMLHSPVLGPDGLLYVSTVTQEVIAVDTSSKNVKWREVVDGKLWNPPLLLNDVIYFGTDKNKAYALNAQNGEKVWTLDSSSAIIGTPVVLADQIAFATEGGEVFTTTPQGARVWPRTITGKLYSTLSISPDLMAVGGLELEYLLVTFTPSGNQGWTYNPPSN